jgi:pSer/pThr/pTyr-binding forkhead associated (FHA) protein
MIDPIAVRWETLITAIGALALAAWSLRSPSAPAEFEGEAGDAKLVIQVVRPGVSAEIVELDDASLIGRGRDCAVVLHDAAVSKWHARLHFDGRRASIEDLNSTNGTHVNGRRMIGGSTLPLRRGDRMSIGGNQLVFVTVVRRAQPPAA